MPDIRQRLLLFGARSLINDFGCVFIKIIKLSGIQISGGRCLDITECDTSAKRGFGIGRFSVKRLECRFNR